MLHNLRYKVATRLAKKAAELIETGDFNNIKKGMRYFEVSVAIVPPSKELSEFGERLRKTAEAHKKLLRDEG